MTNHKDKSTIDFTHAGDGVHDEHAWLESQIREELETIMSGEELEQEIPKVLEKHLARTASKQADKWERILREAVRTHDGDGALKSDTGKPQLSLIPHEALEEMSKALAYGVTKYGRNNYKKGHKWSRCLDAALRHIYALAHGEVIDQESGNTHLSHAMASLCMLAYHMKHHPELNDLYRTYDDITPPGVPNE